MPRSKQGKTMGGKLSKIEAIAQALHDGFAPSNQIPPWRIAKDELKERSRQYAFDFERFLREQGFEITPVVRAALRNHEASE